MNIVIKLDNPYHEEIVEVDSLGYTEEEWKTLEPILKDHAVKEFVGLDYDEE